MNAAAENFLIEKYKLDRNKAQTIIAFYKYKNQMDLTPEELELLQLQAQAQSQSPGTQPPTITTGTGSEISSFGGVWDPAPQQEPPAEGFGEKFNEWWEGTKPWNVMQLWNMTTDPFWIAGMYTPTTAYIAARAGLSAYGAGLPLRTGAQSLIPGRGLPIGNLWEASKNKPYARELQNWYARGGNNARFFKGTGAPANPTTNLYQPKGLWNRVGQFIRGAGGARQTATSTMTPTTQAATGFKWPSATVGQSNYGGYSQPTGITKGRIPFAQTPESFRGFGLGPAGRHTTAPINQPLSRSIMGTLNRPAATGARGSVASENLTAAIEREMARQGRQLTPSESMRIQRMIGAGQTTGQGVGQETAAEIEALIAQQEGRAGSQAAKPGLWSRAGTALRGAAQGIAAGGQGAKQALFGGAGTLGAIYGLGASAGIGAGGAMAGILGRHAAGQYYAPEYQQYLSQQGNHPSTLLRPAVPMLSEANLGGQAQLQAEMPYYQRLNTAINQIANSSFWNWNEWGKNSGHQAYTGYP